MNVLLVGNGGREHAWAIALDRSGVSLITWAPVVNPGIAMLASHRIEGEYVHDPVLINGLDIDLAIIGPEGPLIQGLTDWLEGQGIYTFSPNAANARVEGSKCYMRDFLDRWHIPGNIGHRVCSTEDELRSALEANLEVAIKPDGLTGGKGVWVHGDHFSTIEEALDYGRRLINNDGRVLLEEKIHGVEFSLQALVHGESVVFLPLVKDYKRAYEGDKGPNTGSMGSCSFPDHGLPYLSGDDLDVAKGIMREVVRALGEENGAYMGALYGQFMVTPDGPKVIEFNARLGDPEAINTLALLESPLVEVIQGLADGVEKASFARKASCVVYLVPEGYPESPRSGALVSLSSHENFRFASVKKVEGGYLTSRSRSFAVVGLGDTLSEARSAAYGSIPSPAEGLRWRADIGGEFD